MGKPDLPIGMLVGANPRSAWGNGRGAEGWNRLDQGDRSENADPEQRADQNGIDDADRGRQRVIGCIGRERRRNNAALRAGRGAGRSNAKIGKIAHGPERGSHSLNFS